MLDIICSLLLVQECSDYFRKMQGFELLMSLCKKQSELRRHVIKVFDYALTQYTLNCSKNVRYFIEKGGLPIVFGFFMLKFEESHKKKSKKAHIEDILYIKLTKEDFESDEKHVLNILAGLIVTTTQLGDTSESEGESALPHERVLFKFIENNFEKL